MSLDAVGLIARNIEQTQKFYHLLGVQLQQAGGVDHFEATLPTGMRLMVDSVELIRKINPDWKEATGSRVVLCFRQSSPEAVDELFETITKAGFPGVKEPWNAFWGQRYACVQDPDGNQIDLFSPLP